MAHNICCIQCSDFYFSFFRQYKLRFLMEWQSYLHPWIWMNHVGGRWNKIYSSKLGTFIQKCSDTILRFGSILAISSTLKFRIYLWNFPLYRFWAINRPKKKRSPTPRSLREVYNIQLLNQYLHNTSLRYLHNTTKALLMKNGHVLICLSLWYVQWTLE
jgi:hypothetical protein